MSLTTFLNNSCFARAMIFSTRRLFLKRFFQRATVNTPTKELVYKAILSNRNLIDCERASLGKITKDIKALKLKGASNLGSESNMNQSQVCKVLQI